MVRKLGSVALVASLTSLLCAACASERVVVVMQPDQPVSTPKVAGGEDEPWGLVGSNAPNSPEYARVVEKVAGMVSDSHVTDLARRRGLDVLDLTWEDTGRAMGSALGPNISDLTLQVRRRDEQGRFVSSLMPVVRFPNFTDRTGDVAADRFFVRVGNEKAGQPLRSVPLSEMLKNLGAFASVPASLGDRTDFSAPRDSHFLVSAQAVFLPIPKEGKAEFNPVLFNYQSSPGSPAVLSILVTREGTSVRVIDNASDATDQHGQEIYFNNHGQRASFTAERKSDVETRIAAQGGPKSEGDRSALARGADVLFLIQVPLVHANQGVLGGAIPSQAPMSAASGPMTKKSPMKEMAPADDAESNVEQAVLGHGPNLGKFSEGQGQRLVRDPKFPIRITVQFYKATSNGVVSEADLDGIARSIGSVYEHADFVGSLVMPDGDPRRPTAWQTVPGTWWPW